MSDACCAPGAAGASASAPAAAADGGGGGCLLAPDAEEWANDPTMADCCRRDAQQARYVAGVKAALLTTDPTTAALKLRARVAALPPPSAEAEEEDPASGGELERLRQARLAEMRAAAARAEAAAADGAGSLVDAPEGGLLRELDRRGGAAVVHVVVDGAELCAALDEALAGLAAEHRGTFFARVRVARRAHLLERALPLEAPPPLLLCFRDGALVGQAPSASFAWAEDVDEGALRAHLRRLRVLRRGPGAGAGRPGRGGGGDGAGSSGGEEEEEEDGEGGDGGRGLRAVAPCPTCGRTYPHEHVRAVYGRESSEGGEDSDFGD